MKVEPIVKKWYEALEENKLMGMLCKSCGHYEFPPVPICNECGSVDVEWVEMSGYGTMTSCSVSMVPMAPYEDRGQLVAGFVELKEGPAFISWLVGIEEDEKEGIPARLPLEVEFVADQRDGYKYPVFQIKK